MRRWLRGILLFALFIFLMVITIVYFQWKKFLNTPLNNGPQSFVMRIKEGQSFSQMAFLLKKQNRLSSPRFFIFLVHLKDAAQRLQVGDYLVSPGILPDQLIDKILSGEVILKKFTIVDGWTFERLLKRMNENPGFSHTLTGLSQQQVMERLGVPHISPEGRFFPDTYLFHEGTTDVEILKKAYKKMQTLIQKEWARKDSNLPYKTAEEALVVASLIQKETRLSEEYYKVSSVIRNRLVKNMRLQIDPTVIYGLGKQYVAPLTRSQMAIDTSYNTYTRRGLPPTPIAMVNPKAIYAALHPESSDVLYFVADGSGGHTFTHHYDDHRVAVNSYRRDKNPKKKPSCLITHKICIWILGLSQYGK